jgi:hypothetical protein
MGGSQGIRRISLPLIVAIVVGMTTAVALAASPHFKGGGGAGPAASVNASGGTLSVSGTLAGLGKQGGTITVTAEGSSLFTCDNPSDNEPPGQQAGATTFTGSEPINPDSVDKSGNYHFGPIVTTPPTSPCRHTTNGWTSTLTGFTVSSYTITVSQGGNTYVLGPFSP